VGGQHHVPATLTPGKTRYQNGPKKLENNVLVRTLEKLLVFLVNYAFYATFFYYEKE
jgi:hypothetical protein